MSIFIIFVVDMILFICSIAATLDFIKIKRAGVYNVVDIDSQGGKLIETEKGESFWVSWPTTTVGYMASVILLSVEAIAFTLLLL